jgi:hypothetical protein
MSSIGYDRHRATQRAAARFPAKFPGHCDECGEPIREGDMLRWEGAAAVHADCAPPEAETTEVCGRCFLAIAVNGACGCDS